MLKLNRKLSNHAFESWVLQQHELVTSATTIPLPAPISSPEPSPGFLATKIRLLSNSLHLVNDTTYLLAQRTHSQASSLYEVQDTAISPVAGVCLMKCVRNDVDTKQSARYELIHTCMSISTCLSAALTPSTEECESRGGLVEPALPSSVCGLLDRDNSTVPGILLVSSGRGDLHLIDRAAGQGASCCVTREHCTAASTYMPLFQDVLPAHRDE